MAKTYSQYCPVAHALDLVGDRWTLLILRELSFKARRFSDIRDALPGIALNLLTDRLRELEADGLIERCELPPPAARTVYALTESGRDIRPVLTAMARFGATRLPPVGASTHVTPRAAYVGGLTAFHDPLSSAGIDEHYRIEIDGETFEVLASQGRLRQPAADSDPALTVVADARTLIAVRQGQTSFDDAVSGHRIKVQGPKRSLRNFCLVFSIPRPDGRRAA